MAKSETGQPGDARFHMRRKDREITDTGKIKDIVRKATVCRLGLVDNDGAYIVPVNFGYAEDCLYFHSAARGHKIDLLKRDNRVCFEVESDVVIEKTPQNNCRVKYRSVIGRGTAHIVADYAEKVRGLKAIMRQCAAGEYDLPPDLDNTLVVRIDIESLTGKQAGY